jgi:hypothetical protein
VKSGKAGSRKWQVEVGIQSGKRKAGRGKWDVGSGNEKLELGIESEKQEVRDLERGLKHIRITVDERSEGFLLGIGSVLFRLFIPLFSVLRSFSKFHSLRFPVWSAAERVRRPLYCRGASLPIKPPLPIKPSPFEQSPFI